MGFRRVSELDQWKRRFILGLCFTITLGITGCQMAFRQPVDETRAVMEAWNDEALAAIPMKGSDYMVQPGSSWEPFKIYREVKGIYMTGNTIGLQWRFEELLNETNQSVINAWVVDVKDDHGTMTYASDIPMVNDLGQDARVKVRDFQEAMDIMHYHDIYPIARIVTFKDVIAAAGNPHWAIQTHEGQVWRDRKQDAWLNPYNREAWDYLVDIAKEAATRGFYEVQFDYVRFPTDGPREQIDYGEAGEQETMAEAIAAFLSYAREELKPYGVYVSADIFGLVPAVTDDMRLGQHLETLTVATDILCPMAYPSHYALGTFGVAVPDLEPYPILYETMKRAVERIEAMETDEPKAVLRPWLQDFTASYLGRGYYQRYGVDQVREQIKGTYDSGVNEWLLWNAGNNYTWEALREDVPRNTP
ncbi:putative glycoside hydrolase [Anoxynatronum sibiricum]|uniref:Glycoside hydrolase n=1 Tax=Anoxynatronum sibiricum TaxID=210623 RepID=A0ABU9VYW5_9CLOT